MECILLSLPRFFLAVCACMSLSLAAEPLSYYFPDQSDYEQQIPTPKQVFGFEVGDRHLRHDQLMDYFKQLAQASDKVQITEMGYSHEYRKQIIATISSKENLENLDDILAQRRKSGKQADDAPAVVWLGYSIHGNEISGSNASVLVAYYLAAAENGDVDDMLDDLIIVIEPSMNPDGMDRFTTYANANRNVSLNTDPNHREHHFQWPWSRTNHFVFDLNRDWLPLTQIESQNRVRQYHYYKPNVLGDFHEMGHNSSYFFQPGVPSRNNPITPKENLEMTRLFATYHAKALDKDNSLYYAEEDFDDFFYGKGSTYPDINGTVGILFEQASSRGYAQDTINGVLTFPYSVKNHVVTSFSTLTAAQENKQRLHDYRAKFYDDIEDLADNESFAGYLFTEQHDQTRLNMFLKLLNQHEIQAFPLSRTYNGKEVDYKAGSSYFVPLKQNQYRVIKTIFDQVVSFEDKTFYDVSGWTMPLAFNIQFAKVEISRGLSISSSPWQPKEKQLAPISRDAYAYAFRWDDYLAPKFLNKLLEQGIKARVANQAFTASVNNEAVRFDKGTVIIPAYVQDQSNWIDNLLSIQKDIQIDVFDLQTGLNAGIDIGSPSIVPISPVKVLMIGGRGVSEAEVGHMMFYLDGQMNIPVSVVDIYRLNSINFNDYTHIMLMDGKYNNFPQGTGKRLLAFAEQGGTIYGQKRAMKYLASKNILQASFTSKSEINRAFDTRDLAYDDKQDLTANKRIAGTIFNSQLDTSHPLAYGFNKDDLALFKNSTDIIEMPSKPFITLARYTSAPLMSGYAAEELIDLVSGNAAIIAHNVGKGRVVVSDSNLVFRGYWPGPAKIIANTLFFSKAFSVKISD
ncbi:hypothetical protein E2K93_06765 [Thalassotalea sp. HSM 43]|nr:hypothetical protein E2K93_06765 [Thalassotalea sp. HSM 43]